ncbi:MAG: hypothetical protein ACR2OZ_11345 [Verrucomicrobiales bacterium]
MCAKRLYFFLAPGLLASTSAISLAVDPPVSPGSWTLVLIPDTQNYIADSVDAAIATKQTQWIASRSGQRNIKFAVQVGDLVNNNNDTQWDRIRTTVEVIDGVVPYALCTGNHDCGPSGNGDTRATQFPQADRFGIGSPYAQQPTFRGYFQHPNDPPGNTQNSWHTFVANDCDFLVLTCEWGPRNAVVSWIEERVSAHPFHRVILVVHAYLESSTARYNWSQSQSSMNPHAFGINNDPDRTNDGQDIWDKVARKYQNVCLVCCGHSTRGYMKSRGDEGNDVHQMLYNTQDLPDGGQGWLRLLEFYPDDRTVRARTYSPHLDQSDTSAGDEFTFVLSPVATTDSDSDGLPDYYESRHQLNPNNASDAAADPDADGASNKDEFLAATNPRDSTSKLDVLGFELLSNSSAQLRWRSVPGVAYDVETSSDLTPDSWTASGSSTASDWTSTLGLSANEPRQFFRIVPQAP